MANLQNSALFGKLLNPTRRAFLHTASATAAVGLVGGGEARTSLCLRTLSNG